MLGRSFGPPPLWLRYRGHRHALGLPRLPNPPPQRYLWELLSERWEPLIPYSTPSWSIKVLLRNLPRHYPHNNVYSLFPFSTPGSAIECLTKNSQLPDEIDHSEYDHDTPKQPIVHTLAANSTTISHVLNAPDTYHTPYGKSLKKLTDGYGYVVVTFQGFHDLSLL